MASRSAVIRGRVQGVGFRSFAQTQAWSLGISGEVWNRTDGAVELVYAHDDQAVLNRFEDLLKLGPGRVESVDGRDAAHEFAGVGFSVGPTRR